MLALPPAFETAKWIWPESHFWDLHNSYALFRKTIALARVPKVAALFITADQSYQLYVNGRYVCRGPARGFQSHWPYDEIDIAPWLVAGSNLLAIRAHNPGFSNFQYITQGFAGVLVGACWGKIRVASDNTWKCRRQTGINRATVPTSVQLFSQEHIDLQTEDPDWMQPGYDDTTWNARVAVCHRDSMPWAALEERGIPLLEEESHAPAPVAIGTRAGRCATGFRVTRDAASLRQTEGLGHEPCHFVAEEIPVEPTGKNGFRSYLLDFGRTVVGSVGFEIGDAQGGEIVDTLHVETIDTSSLTPDFMPDEGSRMAFAHRLTCRPGAQTHFFYHAFGFRYMVLTVRGATGVLRVRPQLRTTLYPLEQRGGFRSSDETLEKIWQTCAWTQRVCSLDAYVDTPWREQAQWWGDARVQAKNTFFYSGDTRLFRRGIAQIAAQRTPSGLTYGHAPTMAHSCILPDFSLIWLLTLWDYYWQTESTEPFETHQNAIEEILGYFQTFTDPGMSLVRADPRYWLFLDWTNLQRTGLPSVLNLWLLLALERLAQLSLKTGRKAKAVELTKWRKRLLVALGNAVDEKGFLHDGYDERGRLVAETPIHSQVLALMARVPGVSKTRILGEMLLPFIREERDFSALPSAYWITYVFELLREEGHGREVVDFIRRRWAPMVAHGTTWENFAPRRAHESFSHAWSAHPLYHLMQITGGIVQDAPGWRKIRFAPCFALASCETIVPSPRGEIRSAWQQEGDKMAVHLELPRGIEAEICLPGVPQETIHRSKRWKISLTARLGGRVP